MTSRFEKQVAIITGAATGIGYEIARRLVQEGASVMLNDLDERLAVEAAENMAKEFQGVCHPFPGNAASVNFTRELVAETVARFGRLDLLVANAGMTLFGDFFEFKPEDFRKVVDLNLQGTFFLTQAAARQMRRQGDGGSILLMSSVVGRRAFPYLTAYSMTKAALSMMARSLVLELSPYQITINAIAPGATLTERTSLEDPDYANVWGRLTPNGLVGRPGHIADASLFLLSKEGVHINGQTLVVDGGWVGIGQNPEVVLNPEGKDREPGSK